MIRRGFLKVLAILAAAPAAVLRASERLPFFGEILDRAELRRFRAWAEARGAVPRQPFVAILPRNIYEELRSDPEFQGPGFSERFAAYERITMEDDG
uniref:Uncharacterized protein n=1 Tax=viral metagenome TaxID=1070528 RepID=A0A6M3J4S1_9ZZZZ